MRPLTAMILGILVAATGAHCAEPSETESMIAYSNAFSRALPSNWYVSKAEVTRSWWDHSDTQIMVDFRRRREEHELLPIGPLAWFDACVVCLKKEYNPDLAKYAGLIPFPLLAVTDKHQVYLWGTPAADGWSNSVERLVAAIRTVCPRARVAELSDRDLETNAAARRDSKRDYLRQEWNKSIVVLTNTASGDDGAKMRIDAPMDSHLDAVAPMW